MIPMGSEGISVLPKHIYRYTSSGDNKYEIQKQPLNPYVWMALGTHRVTGTLRTFGDEWDFLYVSKNNKNQQDLLG